MTAILIQLHHIQAFCALPAIQSDRSPDQGWRFFFLFFFYNSLPKNIQKNKNFTNGWTKSINRFKKIRTFIVKLYVLIIHNKIFLPLPFFFCLLQHPIWWSTYWPQISTVLQVILFQLRQNVFAVGVFTQSCDVGSNL